MTSAKSRPRQDNQAAIQFDNQPLLARSPNTGLGFFSLQAPSCLAEAALVAAGPDSVVLPPHRVSPLCQGRLGPEPLAQRQLRRERAGGAGLAGGGGDRAGQPAVPGHGVHVRGRASSPWGWGRGHPAWLQLGVVQIGQDALGFLHAHPGRMGLALL